MKKAISVIGNLAVILLVLLCILLGYVKIQTITNPNQIPSVIGYKLLSVLSGSMYPVFETGDFIIVKEEKDIQEGDIITYRIDDSFVTHRVEEVFFENGQPFYKTKGDANNIQDQYTVAVEQVEGVYQWKIPGGMVVFQFFSHPLGWIAAASFAGLIFTVRAFVKLYRNNLRDSPDS